MSYRIVPSWILALLLLTFPAGAAACGADTDCALGDRTYRIHVPPGAEQPGAIIFAHGFRGSAQGTMKNEGLRSLADRLGVALVAVKSLDDAWRIPGVPADPSTDGAEEIAYFEALVPVLSEKHGIETDRMLMTGFSAGGMMTWQLACTRGDLFAGYAPISGTFWAPVPQTCPGAPVHLFHTHGISDRMVPMKGRPIGPTRQGDVQIAVDMLREEGAYDQREQFSDEELSCTREINRSGHVLELCLHDGGHVLRARFVERAWRRLEALGAL